MEKCTYCVQRINKARIRAKIADRTIEADSFATACQEACPTNAITFGDGNNAEAQVSKKKQSKRNYVMLKELNTRPRTSYLARLRNVHESLAPHGPTDSEHHS
jgi:molybdopterin-containing oxidoreductase family iron-sulfur binding subunit